MLNSWGEWIGRYQVDKRMANMEADPVDLGKSPPREAWVLFILEDETTFYSVQELLKSMKEDLGIERVLGYALLPSDEVPDMATGARDMEYIRSKDLGWTGQLKWDPLQSSDQGGPDLLIDLTDGRSVGMDRLMVSVPAGLRIGRYQNERLPYYDLMLETDEGEGIEDLRDRILRYLELMMNKTKGHGNES